MDAELSSEVGIAGQLFKSCVDLFWLLIQKTNADEALERENKLALRDEFARFYFWGEGFQPEKGGLDEILRFSSSLRDQTISLLTEIGKVLCSREIGFFGVIGSRNIDGKLEAHRQDLTSLIEKLGTSADSDTESTISGDTELEFSLESVLEDLQTYVGCLTKLTLSLENPAPDPVDAETGTVPAITFKVPEQADLWCRRIIDKFQDVDIRLAERLGEANWHRFDRVSKKLEEASDGEISDEEVENGDFFAPLPRTESAISTATRSSFVYDSVLGTNSIGKKSTITTAFSLPSNFEGEFRPKELTNDTASQATWTSVISDVGDLSKLHVPKLPTEALVKKTFRCTVCGDRLWNVKNQLNWKRHVFADLQPYICTIPDCKRGLATFKSRKEWADHEFTVHRIEKVWICQDCSQSFVDRDGFCDHISSHHHKFTNLETDLVISKAERRRVQPPNALTCPFCHITPGSTIKKFATHVGRHLEDIALAVLPCGSEENVESDSERSMESIDTKDLGIKPQTSETNPLSLDNRSDGEYSLDRQQQESDFTIDDFQPSKRSKKQKVDGQSSFAASEASSNQTTDQPERSLQDQGPPFNYAEIKAALCKSTELDDRLDYRDDVSNIKIMLGKDAQQAPETYLAHLKVSTPTEYGSPMRIGRELYLVLSWHVNGRVYVAEASKTNYSQLFVFSGARKWVIEELSMVSYYQQGNPSFMLTTGETRRFWEAKVREEMDLFLLRLITACFKYTNGSRPLLSGINAHELEYTLRESGPPPKNAENTQSRAKGSLKRIELSDRPAGPKMVEDPDRRGERLNKTVPANFKEPLKIPSDANPRFAAINDQWSSEDFKNKDEWSIPPARSMILSSPYLDQRATGARGATSAGGRDPPPSLDRYAPMTSLASDSRGNDAVVVPSEPGRSRRSVPSRTSRSSVEKDSDKSKCAVM